MSKNKVVRSRLVSLGRASSTTRAVFIGKNEELGHYPMVYPTF